MTREEFTAFVARTLEEVIELAERKAGKKLSRKIAFQWLGRSETRMTDNILNHILERVFIDENHIYPCVDIGVGDLLDDDTLLIIGSIAGYPPRPFGQNWTGRQGPFVHVVGTPFLAKVAGKKHDWTPGKIFGFITPDVF